MAKKKKKKQREGNRNNRKKRGGFGSSSAEGGAVRGEGKQKYPLLTTKLKKWLGVIFLLFLGLVVALSFFEMAGRGGEIIFDGLFYVIGRALFFIPFLLFLGAFLIIRPQKKRNLAPVLLSLLLFISGITGLLTIDKPESRAGGWWGNIVSWPFLNYFGLLVAYISFSVLTLAGLLILWEFLPKKKKAPKKKGKEAKEEPMFSQVSTEQKAGQVKFEIKPIELLNKSKGIAKTEPLSIEQKSKFSSEPCLTVDSDYQRPPLTLFDLKEEKPSSGDIDQLALIIKKTLLNFSIEVEMAEVNVGPTVTQFTLKPAEGVKLSKITALNNDLALALASHPIRIEAPVPGRALVGIEVPNKKRAVVKLGNLLEALESAPASHLSFALGRDVMGQPIFPDLDRMPHLLVAGATGSGKTIGLNSLIVSLICRNSPKALRFILIDPKRVEFPVYSNLPHLLAPVIFRPQKAVNALNWLVAEMERRFDILKDFGARDIASYNQGLSKKTKTKNDDFEPMPYIVLIIDELADLMLSKGKEVEAGIVRISQLARAVGIHLVVATQRPSVEVITGLIKANITSRVAFQVASQVDSRTILDASGAEKLLGRGDMLYISSEFSKPKRIQGSFITAPEIKKIVQFIEKENAPEPTESLDLETTEQSRDDKEINLDDSALEEPLYNDAKQTVIEYGKASASLLQRRLKIGYARAARILDMLEQNGIVGPQDGAKPREVFAALKTEDRDDGYHDAGDIKFEYK